MDTLILGIDVGTTNAKALLATPDGKVVAQATAGYPLLTPQPGWVEQNPEDWWQGVATVVRAVLTNAAANPDQIAAVAMSGQGGGAVLVDENANPIRPGIIWMDGRSDKQSAAMRDRADDRVLAINGKSVAPYNYDPKLVWLQAHEPETIEKAAYCLTTTGYINFKLTGKPIMNVSDASIPFAFDQLANDWSEELIEAFGIPRRLYPPVAASETIIGKLTPEAAAATGLVVGIPVIAGGEDTSSAGLAVGVSQPGQAMLSLGTGGSIYIAQDKPLSHPLMLIFAHVLEKQWFVGGTIVAFGASLAWCKNLLKHADFEHMNTLASEADPGANGLLFLPYLSGELQPINDGNARGVFFGLSLNTTQAELIRAVMEGTAFAMRHNILVAEEVGATVRELRAVGGPTKSPVWCQIIADVTQQPLTVLSDNPGAPLGNVFLAASAIGLIPDAGEAAAAAAKVDRIYEPNSANRDRYDRLFDIYRQLYPNLKAQFAAISQI
jgi:xylulokinase